MLLDRATGVTRGLTDDFDFWVDDFRWSSDSRAISTSRPTCGAAARSSASALAGGAPAALWTGGAIGGMAVAGNRVFFGTSTLSRAAELWSVGVDGKAPAALTHVNDGLFGDLDARRGLRAFHRLVGPPQAPGLGRQAPVVRSVEEISRPCS